MRIFPEFATERETAIPIRLVRQKDLKNLDEFTARWARTTGFAGKSGQMLAVPDRSGGNLKAVLVGDPRVKDVPAERFFLASILQKLVTGSYRLEGDFNQQERDEAALASLLAQYQFDRYTKRKVCRAKLILPEGCERDRLLAIAAAEFVTRDLINQPASHLRPAELEAVVAELADAHAAQLSVIKGERLRDEFPLVQAVGAAGSPPRFLDFRWGRSGDPKLAIIGKGVCFDSGGLNIKPSRSMGLMKKDMGGAAVAIGLAKMIMTMKLRLQIQLLIPAVENAISDHAMRPGDVLNSRAGLTVEVTNTDAEGRLVLADAIAYAQQDSPDLLLTLATLTGAARVALGPEIVPFYSENDEFSATLENAARRVRDPLWRMPLWRSYDTMLKSNIADCVNATKSGFAGSITAALFLRKFVKRPDRWAHFDLYCWQNESRPGRLKGGVGQASRALIEALPEALGR